jgi:hypothetical protein
VRREGRRSDNESSKSGRSEETNHAGA